MPWECPGILSGSSEVPLGRPLFLGLRGGVGPRKYLWRSCVTLGISRIPEAGLGRGSGSLPGDQGGDLATTPEILRKWTLGGLGKGSGTEGKAKHARKLEKAGSGRPLRGFRDPREDQKHEKTLENGFWVASEKFLGPKGQPKKREN